MGQMSQYTEENKNLRSAVRVDSACDAILEDPVLLLCRMAYACSTLQEKSLLLDQEPNSNDLCIKVSLLLLLRLKTAAMTGKYLLLLFSNTTKSTRTAFC
jgi:hypothetical protein